MTNYALLHAPHLALLRAALVAASPHGARVALDLACGAGGKTAWLREVCAPGALVLGLDLDPDALCAAQASDLAGLWAGADAHALPLRPGSVDLIWCVAALGLFADQGRALAEARRALAPGGALVVVSASERWVRPRRWAALAHEGQEWPGDRAPGAAGCGPPADDLGGDLRAALEGAELGQIALAAYLLDPPGLAPLEAMLPLADLVPAEPLAIGEPEPLPVLLVGAGRR